MLTEDAPLEQPAHLEDARRLHALAELRLAQARPREALELSLKAGETIARTITWFGYCPWRTTAALAAAALDDRARALELAREALTVAERAEVLHARIGALRVLGMCEQGAQGIAHLRTAVELGTSAPPRIETVRAMIELGAALRRANQRAAAREPLQRAADLAQRGGAKALDERARTELAAAGARPRRDLLLEGPASLTPSERRIAELAAGQLSNREIARKLFVTPKTVEYHLRNAYRKLGIERRGSLRERSAASGGRSLAFHRRGVPVNAKRRRYAYRRVPGVHAYRRTIVKRRVLARDCPATLLASTVALYEPGANTRPPSRPLNAIPTAPCGSLLRTSVPTVLRCFLGPLVRMIVI